MARRTVAMLHGICRQASRNRRTFAHVFAALSACALSAGCGSALSGARAAFDDARYADAAIEFREVEAEQSSEQTWEPAERARYHLYRGLNSLALGDARDASTHLQQTRMLLESDPNLLSAAEQGRLFSAWRSMGKAPGESLSVLEPMASEP